MTRTMTTNMTIKLWRWRRRSWDNYNDALTMMMMMRMQDVRIYDLISQTLIQVFFRKAFMPVGLRPMNALYVNQVTNRIILASKNLVCLDVRVDDPAMMPLASHNQPINVVLYNGLFRQVSHCRSLDWSLRLYYIISLWLNIFKRCKKVWLFGTSIWCAAYRMRESTVMLVSAPSWDRLSM